MVHFACALYSAHPTTRAHFLTSFGTSFHQFSASIPGPVDLYWCRALLLSRAAASEQQARHRHLLKARRRSGCSSLILSLSLSLFAARWRGLSCPSPQTRHDHGAAETIASELLVLYTSSVPASLSAHSSRISCLLTSNLLNHSVCSII